MLACLFTHLSIKFVIYAVLDNEALKISFNTFIDLAYGPLLWMYAKKISNDKFQPMRYWYHLLPTFLAAMVYSIICINILTGFSQSTTLITLYNKATTYLIVFSFLLYPLMTLSIARKLPAFWLSEKKLIISISLLFGFISVCSNIILITDAVKLSTPGYFAMPLRTLAYSFLLTTSFLIIRYRITTQNLLRNVAEETSPNVAFDPDEESTRVANEEKLTATVIISAEERTTSIDTNLSQLPVRKALLTEEVQQEIAAKLISLIAGQKVFTNPELTLEKLSALTNIPRNHISETLNQYIGKSFYQFINEFRIEEVAKILDRCKRQNLTPNILPIAFEAGFHSKTSFNQYFKKYTGLTPSDYLKKGKTQLLTSPVTLQFSATQMAH